MNNFLVVYLNLRITESGAGPQSVGLSSFMVSVGGSDSGTKASSNSFPEIKGCCNAISGVYLSVGSH